MPNAQPPHQHSHYQQANMAAVASLAKNIRHIKAAMRHGEHLETSYHSRAKQLVAMALLIEGRTMSSKSILMQINEAFP
jgi:hypothetical protein